MLVDGHAERGHSSGDDAGGGVMRLTVFGIDSRRYALPVEASERVLPMVAISPLPGAPDVVVGAINLHGEIVPVLDVRRRLGLAPHEYGPEARLLVARSRLRIVALVVDEVFGVTDVDVSAVAPPERVLPGIEHVSGVAAVADGLILIQDLDRFFSLEEERRLDASLAEVTR